jgi:hypothetical protein
MKLEEIRKTMELHSNMYFGIRGLSGVNAAKKYRNNQILACSCDLDDDRGVERYTSKKLIGTSAIPVDADMTNNEITSVIALAAKYSDGKVCLISGEQYKYGADDAVGEILLYNNKTIFETCGARFVGYIETANNQALDMQIIVKNNGEEVHYGTAQDWLDSNGGDEDVLDLITECYNTGKASRSFMGSGYWEVSKAQ